MATDDAYLAELKASRVRLLRDYESNVRNHYPTLSQNQWTGIKRLTKEIDRIENGGWFGH